MIGAHQLQLGADQFTSGMSSSDFATDGALGTSSVGLNPFSTPGLMRAITNPTDISTNVAGNIIASAEDSQTTSSLNRTFVDDAGNYYTFNGTTVTLSNTATTNAAGYIQGKTDMVSFAGNTYVTTTISSSSSAGDIDRWNTSSLTLTNSWWKGTASQSGLVGTAPHPLLVYQGAMYIADANKLHTLSADGSTIAIGVLVLNSNEIIYALGIDPGTGLMMISVQTVTDISDQLSSRHFVYLYDGISAKATRKIAVDDLVTAFYNVEGIVYIGAGQILGQWNGSGVTFLRKMANVSLQRTDLLYKHHFTNTRNILHVVDGMNILSYGAVVSGKKGFFYTAFNPSGNGHLSIVMPLGNNQIGVAYTTNKLQSFDLSAITAGTATLYFNNIYFPRPVFIRRVRIITTGITTTGGIGGMSLFDEKGHQFSTTVSTFKVLSTATPQYVFDFDYTNVKLQGVQPRLIMDTQSYGIVRVILYYDIAE